jgi:hypothetical protein
MKMGKKNYIVDNKKECKFLVNRKTFVDPEILAEEQEKIFSRCWIFFM